MLCLALTACLLGTGDPDTDRDGLSDFAEIHKYLTDPQKADSDGDGIPDGDWNERREYAYSVHAVMHVMAPFDVASMNDDYQDVRVLDERPDLLEFEVVVYPFNTVASAIVPDEGWRKLAADLKPHLSPGPCCNWDEAMQRDLRSALIVDGIDVTKLDDVETVARVSKWLMQRAKFEDSFTTFAVDFDDGKPRVTERQRENVDATLKRFGRTLEEQWDRELFGAGMYRTKTIGSCTSAAIYLSTALKAIGIPTRTVICVPVVDANDAREVSWIDARIAHRGVRALVKKAAADQRGSWTSHTSNEVWVGKRWRRLNYTALGQNVLDAEYLGLMVHVYTYVDQGTARLSGWGNREVHPLHTALFGGANPYSCTSLSDRFGAHAKVANEPLASVRELEIGRAYWYDDPKRDAKLSMSNLADRETAGHVLVHVDTEFPNEGSSAYGTFYGEVSKQFELRASGRDPIPLRAARGYWIDSDKDLKEFYLRIEPADYARMQPGVDYALAWLGEKDADFRWTVRSGVALRHERR